MFLTHVFKSVVPRVVLQVEAVDVAHGDPLLELVGHLGGRAGESRAESAQLGPNNKLARAAGETYPITVAP